MKKYICPECGSKTEFKEEIKYGGQKWVYVEYCTKCKWNK